MGSFMRLRPHLLILGGALALAATLGLSIAAAPAPQGATPEQIIAARQAAYDMSAMTMAEMQQALKDGTDLKKQAFAANALVRWSKALPTMFPVGTGHGETALPTKARAEIWSNRSEFEKAAANYTDQATKLVDLARAGDSEGFSTQLKQLDKACDACHDKFKEK